jgi:hypothetical protein
VSGPLVPTLLTARATPLASNRATTIVVNKSRVRLINATSSKKGGVITPPKELYNEPSMIDYKD